MSPPEGDPAGARTLGRCRGETNEGRSSVHGDAGGCICRRVGTHGNRISGPFWHDGPFWPV